MPIDATPGPRPAGTRVLSRAALAVAVSVVPLAFSACAEEHVDLPIREVRTIETERPRLGASSAERFGFRPREHAAAPEAATEPFAFELPEGWARGEQKAMRDVNLVGPGPVECWISVLPPQPLVPNLDRWRRQLGLDPASEADVAALPRVPLLGGEAVEADLVSTDGDTRMIGLMLLEPDESVFVRMQGSPEAVAAQRDEFEAFCESLRRAEASSTAAAPAPVAGASADGLAWQAPAGWEELPGSMFQLVSFQITPDTKAWISLLGGDGGGLAANVDRWCGQVGRAPLDPAELAALPTLSMLGRQATLVELLADGQREGLIVTVCPQPELGRTVFVKMQGPLAEVRAHESAFKKFCESIQATGG